jgi:hypothetical protein
MSFVIIFSSFSTASAVIPDGAMAPVSSFAKRLPLLLALSAFIAIQDVVGQGKGVAAPALKRGGVEAA